MTAEGPLYCLKHKPPLCHPKPRSRGLQECLTLETPLRLRSGGAPSGGRTANCGNRAPRSPRFRAEGDFLQDFLGELPTRCQPHDSDSGNLRESLWFFAFNKHPLMEDPNPYFERCWSWAKSSESVSFPAAYVGSCLHPACDLECGFRK